LKELFIEKAKLYWEKGEQDPAFFTLRRGLEEHFSNVENPESYSASTDQDDSKICAEVTSDQDILYLFICYSGITYSLNTQCVQVLVGLCLLEIQDVNYFQNFTVFIIKQSPSEPIHSWNQLTSF
jgi:hypothetical protein